MPSFALCFVELLTLLVCTCSPVGNMLMTLVLLFSCLLIGNSHLKLLAIPKVLWSVFICKSISQWHKKSMSMLRTDSGECGGQLMNPFCLSLKLAKSLCKYATHIRNTKRLGRCKLVFTRKKDPCSFNFCA